MSLYLPILAVCIGFGIAYKMRSNSQYLKMLLPFSGGFLLSVAIIELLPELYHHEHEFIGIFILLGIILQLILEFFSKGAEHGHIHINQNSNRFPYLLFVSLAIHAFFEGFPTHQHPQLLLGVIIHKVPIAILLSSFLLNSNLSKLKIIVFMSLFALMTPLGSLTHILFEEDLMHIKIWIEAVVLGILFHIASTILFETSKDHKFNMKKFMSIFIGMSLAIAIHFMT